MILAIIFGTLISAFLIMCALTERGRVLLLFCSSLFVLGILFLVLLGGVVFLTAALF